MAPPAVGYTFVDLELVQKTPKRRMRHRELRVPFSKVSDRLRKFSPGSPRKQARESTNLPLQLLQLYVQKISVLSNRRPASSP
jgi:hypothetical protein